jgi:hypothetical protein
VPLVCLVLAAGACGFAASSAYTAGNTVPSTNVGQYTHSIGAADLKPAACTGTLTAIANVPAGGATDNVAGTGNLILGTSGNDTVKVATNGYNCFVGGGPTASNADKFTGPTSGGSQCIVATSDPAANITKCTIVQRSP